jgi:hypothetical protein
MQQSNLSPALMDQSNIGDSDRAYRGLSSKYVPACLAKRGSEP